MLYKKLKLAILGCGMVADYHIKGVLETGDAEIVALCDSSSSVLTKMLKKYNIGRGETDYARILADENINAVIICTPPDSHYQLAMEAISAHKHVLIEKPFVITKSEMYSLQHKAANNPHLVVMESSARHSRLQPKFNYIKNLISSGDLGDIYAIHHNAVFRKSRPGIEYHADATWFYDKKLAGGGPLIDWGVYDLSFHLGILNDNVNLKYLKSFHVNGLDQKSANDKFSVEEHGIVMMEFDNKLIYYWERASNAHNEALNETRIYGSKGGLKFNYLTWGPSKIIYYRLTRKGISKKNLIPLEMGKHKSYLEDFYALDAHFVQCILGKQKPTTRHGEHKVRSQGARDRRALTGEAGNASRRQVIVGDAGMNPIRDECASDAGRSRPNNSRVMRTNFGGMTAEIFREHSDSLVLPLSSSVKHLEIIFQALKTT